MRRGRERTVVDLRGKTNLGFFAVSSRAVVTVTVSSKGQVVLPGPVRRRLGLGPGTKLVVVEELDGVRLKLQRAVPSTSVAQLSGMVTARSKGSPRRLADFDAARLLRRGRH